MPIDRETKWIEKFGGTKHVKDWIAANPPPADWTKTPQRWAYSEMPDDPEPDELSLPNEMDEQNAPVTRREVDELRAQVARVAKGFNRAIKKNRERTPDPPPTPLPGPPSDEGPKKLTGLAAILEPLKRRP